MPLRSAYTSAVTAIVDVIFPDPSTVSTTTAEQVASMDGKGQTKITLTFVAPTLSSKIEEFIGAATGGTDVFETTGEPILAGSLVVLETSTFGGAGRGDTTLSAQADIGDERIDVNSITDFDVGDLIRLIDGSTIEYGTVESVSGSTIFLEGRLINEFTSGSVVQEVVSPITKSEGTDYTVDLSTGQITLIAGQFTSSNEVVAQHTIEISDIDKFELYRSATISSVLRIDDIQALGDVVVVDTEIDDTTVSDELTSAENGQTLQYYLFARDTAGNHSLATRVEVETIPSTPLGLDHSISTSEVILTWSALSGSEVNANGFNIYRAEGPTFSAINLLKLNSSLLPVSTTSFNDSAAGVLAGERVPTVELPVDDFIYFYLVETEDTTTNWTVGTQNLTATTTFSGVASK